VSLEPLCSHARFSDVSGAGPPSSSSSPSDNPWLCRIRSTSCCTRSSSRFCGAHAQSDRFENLSPELTARESSHRDRITVPSQPPKTAPPSTTTICPTEGAFAAILCGNAVLVVSTEAEPELLNEEQLGSNAPVAPTPTHQNQSWHSQSTALAQQSRSCTTSRGSTE
jgi:hypothetical protein